jgi:dGTPase
VSWADRIAYVCHDFEDAVAADVVTPDQLPRLVSDRIGTDRSSQLGNLIRAMIQATTESGRIGMTNYFAEALAEFRRFNYEAVYLRPASKAQADAVIAMLRALVEHYAAQPRLLPDGSELDRDSPAAYRSAVTYVGGMTDRFACRQAMALLGWERDRLPVGIDV